MQEERGLGSLFAVDADAGALDVAFARAEVRREAGGAARLLDATVGPLVPQLHGRLVLHLGLLDLHFAQFTH